MAIGLAQLLGFHFPENFRRPYLASSITEFWRRWHISLSTWLRDYLYIPLGGNRGGRLKTYRNLMLTMLLGGLWHGASWNFVIWGGYHGGPARRRTRSRPRSQAKPEPIARAAYVRPGIDRLGLFSRRYAARESGNSMAIVSWTGRPSDLAALAALDRRVESCPGGGRGTLRVVRAAAGNARLGLFGRPRGVPVMSGIDRFYGPAGALRVFSILNILGALRYLARQHGQHIPGRRSRRWSAARAKPA